jgi:hypothetical protein
VCVGVCVGAFMCMHAVICVWRHAMQD